MAEKKKPTRAVRGEGSIFPRENGTWGGYVPVNGKRKHFSAPTRAEAMQLKRELLNTRDQGVLTTGKAMTVGEWVAYWIEERATDPDHPLSLATAANYRHLFAKDVAPMLGHIRLDKLRIEDVKEFQTALAGRGLGQSSRRQRHMLLHAALHEAVARGHAMRNPVAYVKAPKVGKADTSGFSEAELDRLFDAAVDDRYEARWHLALVYGLRPGEATAIQWSDIDLGAGTLTIRNQLQQVDKIGTILVPKTKTEAGAREIHLAPYLVTMLRKVRTRQKEDRMKAGEKWAPFTFEGKVTDFVFTREDGQPLRASYDDPRWKALLVKARVEDTRRYTARHTAASAMIADGADIAVVAQTLGHGKTSFTFDTYVHPVDERKKALADRFEKRHGNRAAS